MSDNPNWSSNAIYNTNSKGFLTFYGNYMYFPNRAYGSIVQTNLDGTINNSSYAQGLAPGGCFAYNGYLYVSNYNGGPGDGVITRIKLSDGTSIGGWAQVGSGPTAMATDGTYLYVSCYFDNNVYRVSLNTPATSITYLSVYAPYGLATDSNYLYIASNNGIQRAPLNVTNTYTQWSNLQAYGIVVVGNYLYATANNNIYQILLSDVNSQVVLKSNANVGGLTYYNNYLYGYGNQNIAQFFLPGPPSPPCFKEGTKILTMKGYKLVQDLRKGDMIKTLRDEYKAIEMIGKKEIIHCPTPENRVKEQLYVCSNPEFEDVYEPLVLTGCHSILVEDFISEEQRQKTIEVNGNIYLTDNKYRLPACAHHGTTVYETPGTYMIYHLALENEDYFMNYGIYANGLLVESCSRRYLKELSNMELIE